MRQDQGTLSYQLYSPDAVTGYGGYANVSEGMVITLTTADRDKTLEAQKERPLAAYYPQSNPHAGAQGEPNYFKNKQGVEMLGYTHSYEGCFMRVMFTGAQSVYSAEIETGGACPDDAILANADIKSFIDSVELGDKSSVESDVYITSSGGSKTDATYKIYVGALKFEYTRFSDEQSGLALLQPNIIPKLKGDGTFEKLISGATSAQLSSGYNCEGCGFTLDTYDSSIVFAATKPSTEGFTRLANNIYGKQEGVKPIQKDASATKYTYIKTVEGGSFTLTSTVEQHNSDHAEQSLTLPAFMQTLESLRML